MITMIPAPQSRPVRKWQASGLLVEDPFWAGVTVVIFLCGIVMLAKGSLDIARMLGPQESESTGNFLFSAALSFIGFLVVIGLVIIFGKHPRTRSHAASVSFSAMMTLMLLAGVALFFGGAFRIVETTEFVEQVVLALLSLFFLATPLIIRFTRE